MYAIIATGGKQYKVSEGDIIRVEKLGKADGEAVTFDQVLALNDGELKVGTPTVTGATVSASVLREGKAKKVIVYKYKPKKGHHKKTLQDRSEKSGLLLDSCILGLMDIGEEYSDFININLQEVK